MERPLNETASTLEQLTEEVRELDRRVRALESRSAATIPFSNGSPVPAPVLQSVLTLPASLSVGLVPVLGKAVLGIAGAYLLRAGAESGALAGPVARGTTSWPGRGRVF